MLNRRAAALRDAARVLRRPAAMADEQAVASGLKISAASTSAIEATEPVGLSLLESLKKRSERVQELKRKIELLRTLSDDVNTTPAEAGTAHRTANSLQAEHDSLAEVLIEAEAAAEAFVDARDEFLAAQAAFSTRYQNSESAARLRAPRQATTSAKPTRRGVVAAPEPTLSAARKPEPGKSNMKRVVGIIVAIVVSLAVRTVIRETRHQPRDETAELQKALTEPELKPLTDRFDMRAERGTRSADGNISGAMTVDGKRRTFQQSGKVLTYRDQSGAITQTIEIVGGDWVLRHVSGAVCRGPKGDQFMQYAVCEQAGQTFRFSDLLANAQ